MGKIIVILLVIIILILIAPGVLAFLGLLFAIVIASIIQFWWLFLIAVIGVIALPFILKIGEKAIVDGKKLSPKNKFYIFSFSAILVLSVVLGILVKNKTILTYPILCEDHYALNSSEEAELIKRANEKLFNDRGNYLNNTIPFGGFSFGMTKKEVLNYIRKNKMSSDLFFENYTLCKVQLIDTLCAVPFNFEFDNQNKLKKVNVLIYNGYKTDYSLKKFFGNKYVEKNSYNQLNNEITWIKGNQEIKLICHKDLFDDYSDYYISFTDNNYTGKLNSTPIYNPYKEIINRTIVPLNKKINTIMGFQIGMTQEEVEKSKKILIAQLIKKKAYKNKNESIDLTKLKSFLFYLNDYDYICVDSLKFSFNYNRLSYFVINQNPGSTKCYNLFRILQFDKLYGTGFIKKQAPQNEYTWIINGVKIDYSWDKIIYTDMYVEKLKIAPRQTIVNSKTHTQRNL